MKLLITPALPLSPEQIGILAQSHQLFFISDERQPIETLSPDFSLSEIEGIVCNIFFLHNPLSVLPNLKFIQLTSAGLDRVPVEEIRQKGITLCSAGATYAVPMAEWVVGKLLELCKQTPFFYANQQNRRWEKHRQLRELSELSATIIGFGNVGQAVAARLKPFGVHITAVDLLEDASGLADRWLPFHQLDTALSTADIVILCLPLTEQTRGFMDEARFAAMKPGAMLINVARGALMSEQALIRHMRSGHLSGAALDVFDTEPLPENSPLWTLPNTIITPHNSFVSCSNNKRLFALLQKNLSLASKQN